MAKPFKFRYVNEITGAFVLLVVAALVAGIFVAGRAQKWFEPIHELEVVFPEEGSFDLQRGAEVRILGALVGSLEEISVAEEGEMSGVIRIRGNFIRFVRTDCRAVAKKKFGLAGDAYLEITKGSGPPLPEDAVMKVEKDTEITEMIQEVIERVEEVALPAIKQVQKALEEYTNLAVDLRDKEGNLQQLLAHLSRLAEGLEKGEGTAGQLLRDPSLAEELRAIAAKVDE